MDFYEELVSPYTMAISVPITTNLPNAKDWWKIKNKDWSNQIVRQELNDNYTAEILLNNVLNTFSENDIFFRIIDNKQDSCAYLTKLYDEVISKEELISYIKQMATTLIDNINNMDYQIMCTDNDITTAKNGKIWTPVFDIKTGEYLAVDNPIPITLKIELNL